ncbi:MAG: alpha-L-arabinofuranosidase C-terminal domain-containing protein [Sedimentisphaerales bacterium]
MSAEKIAISIDGKKTAAPVSKYIYGQFIEHLGRCIYGGIWAEMLEDRKFFYQPGTVDSPWKILGSEPVIMNCQNPYVGEHSPKIKDGGLQQQGLGLVKGKDYVGRIVAAGNKTKLQISLIWDEGKQTQNIDLSNSNFKTFNFKFTSGGNTDDGKLEISGRGEFCIGAVSLMPADNINDMRADTLKLLKELNAPIYRWPGGNFVSGYNWRDGIGDRDKRPPRKNPAWQGLEHNDFGIDEFLQFCREINAEPLIVVNSGFGDDHSAAEEVRYVNVQHKYNVKWWGIGNEMYGSWQLGHISLEQYTRKHNLFAKAMRQVDPNIKIIAVGDVGFWSQGMLKNCADNMDLISEHFYCGEKPSLLEHVSQIPQAVTNKVAAHRQYRKEIESLKGKNIEIALDEWNYWYGKHIFGELGTRYYLKDALGIAAGLNEMIRNSDIIYMANYAQTVNVIGAIKTNKTAAEIETTGLVLKLYRNQFGTLPIEITEDTKPLDVAAAWTADNKGLTIAIVNPTENKYELCSKLNAVELSGKAKLWLISNADPMAFNDPGKEPMVSIVEKQLSNISDSLDVPPLSICLYKLETSKGGN